MLEASKQIWTGESGQGLPEYALLVAAVVALVVLVAELFTDQILGLINSIGTYISTNDPT